MLNFYRRFLPHVTATQAPLHDILSSPKVKGSHPIFWTPVLHKAFEECKVSLSHTTLLAHPDPDASTSTMGAILQQRVNNAWQPLAFFSKKLSPAQQKYSAYDRELLAVYEAMKHFHHMLEACHFIIFTDHKPITYAFQQKQDKCSPWQFNHLDFIAQFTTDIRHISGQDNVVADALSRRIRHCATILRCTGRIPGQRRGAMDTSGVEHRPAARETTDSHKAVLLREPAKTAPFRATTNILSSDYCLANQRGE
jgi:cleavage and polyadenylation specificity factor subunit 1